MPRTQVTDNSRFHLGRINAYKVFFDSQEDAK